MDSPTDGRPRVVREPRVAGSFYPAGTEQLGETVDKMITAAPTPEIKGRIVALFCPHAGYAYSGPTAAAACKALAGRDYATVVVIGPSHHAYFEGVSVYDRGPYRTPLGLVEIDTEMIDALERGDRSVRYVSEAHRDEHSVEVQLPFLQRVLKSFKLVPLVMGDQEFDTCRRLAELLAGEAVGRSVLVVASSDLYHGYSYEECRRVDDRTVGAIAAFDIDGLAAGLARREMMACGGGPILAAMVFARKLQADSIRIVGRANSGDVTGDRSGYIVGYAAGLMLVSDSGDAR